MEFITPHVYAASLTNVYKGMYILQVLVVAQILKFVYAPFKRCYVSRCIYCGNFSYKTCALYTSVVLYIM
jgi:hypothetical protein